MALLTSEIVRIKFELGYNVETIGASPYIGISAIFESVIATYTQAGATTTSATAVTAASSATPVALTLASATGFAAFDTVVIDVDARQERATVQSLTGSVITVLLTGTHSGTYPVTVEGGEAIVRDLLRQLRAVGYSGGRIESTVGTAGIRRVDDIEFFGDSTTVSQMRQVRDHQMYLRDELASALGVENLSKARAASSAMSLY